MRPVYKIEIYDSTPDLIHTITSDALDLRIKETLTQGIGTFSFTVPTVKGVPDPYYYNDVAVNDTVKMWLGYESVSGDPLTVGKIYQITAHTSVDSGYLRHFACANQGEILQRRIKTRKAWEGMSASTIVELLCDDLGLGKAEIAADATAVTLTTDGETYFDVLSKVSDYWFNAGTQVKKDFFVNVDNNLVWKTRPIRTAGVETLTVGDNIVSYRVLRDVLAVRNKIWVYGHDAPYDPNRAVLNYAGRTFPVGGDEWTYGTGWTASKGTLSSDATDPKVGANDLRCTADANFDCGYYRTFSQLSVEGKEGYSALQFWGRRSALLADWHHVRLWCPNITNNFEWEFADPGVNGVWAFRIARLGDNNTYDADTNPSGEWTVGAGSPTWNDIQGIEFMVDSGMAFTWDLDGCCFSFGRWRGLAEDAASQTSYGQRDVIIVDDLLLSDSDCEKRAETRLYQLKDGVNRLDVVVVGNTNVKIGDRLAMTIPAEGISAANYDVVTVEHLYTNKGGFVTRAVLVNSANIRQPPATNIQEILVDQQRNQRLLGKGLHLIAR